MQRVGDCRALITKPAIVLGRRADPATLDSRISDEVLGLIKRHPARVWGKTVVMITHK